MPELVKPGRYAMFLRKSREDIEAEKEGRFETLAKHEMQLSELSSMHGTRIVAVYRELVSGDSLEAREECRRMLADVQSGAYDGVYAFDLQRLTRGDMIDQGTILRAFSVTGTLIVTPEKVYDPSDMLDSDYMEMRLMFGRMEYSQIKRRMKSGKENSVRQGQYIGSRPPFGWDKAVDGRKKTLVPNEDNETVVAWYEDIAAHRTTPGKIADDLNRRGIPALRGGKWYAHTVNQIIRNPINKGYVRWNMREAKREFQDGELVCRRVKSEAMVCKALWDGAVSEELWDAANEAIDSKMNHHAISSKKLANPLAGLLRCAKCGKPMRRMRRRGGSRWGYTHPKETAGQCWTVGSDADIVVRAVVDALAAVADNLEVGVSEDGAYHRSLERRKAILEAQAAEERAASANLLRLAEKGLISDEEFAESRSGVSARLSVVQDELRSIAAEEADAERHPRQASMIRDLIPMLAECRDVESVNRALKQVVRRIDYEKELGGRIRLNIILR